MKTAKEVRGRYIAGAVVLMLLAVITASWVFWRDLRVRQMTKLKSEANESLAGGDFANASLQIRRVLDVYPQDIEAFRLMAELAERVQDAESAISWRQRAVELDAGSEAELMSYAATCLKFDRLTAANNILARIPLGSHKSPRFQLLSGEVAFRKSDFQRAERWFQAAANAEPKKLSTQLSLRRSQALLEDYFGREAGRNGLLKLAAEADFEVAARNALVASFRTFGQPQEALEQSNRLLLVIPHPFSEDIENLSLLAVTRDPDFPRRLETLQKSTSSNPQEAAALLEWMSGTGFHAEGLEWIKRNRDLSASPEMQPSVTACYIASREWETALQYTAAQSWNNLEALRHAYRAKAFREQAHLTPAATEWQTAISAAGNAATSLAALANLAAAWNWEAEEEEVLLLAVEKSPEHSSALRHLNEKYSREGNTRALRKLASLLMQVDPTDQNVQNDYALLSLLLGEDTERATRIARELFAAERQNPAFASTYAFALYLAGQPMEALKTMEVLKEADLEVATISAYYGFLLLENGQREQARKYLLLATSAQVLPEERAFLANAGRNLSLPDFHQ